MPPAFAKANAARSLASLFGESRAGGADQLPRAASAELAIAGVAQAGQDVALLVELAVHGRAVDLDIRMSACDGVDSLRRHDQVDELDTRRAPTLEHLDRRRCRSARGQHRVEDQAQVDAR